MKRNILAAAILAGAGAIGLAGSDTIHGGMSGTKKGPKPRREPTRVTRSGLRLKHTPSSRDDIDRIEAAQRQRERKAAKRAEDYQRGQANYYFAGQANYRLAKRQFAAAAAPVEPEAPAKPKRTRAKKAA